MVRHALYGLVSVAEPKQKIAGRHGTDTGKLGVVSETIEETSQFCRLDQSNGENIENLYRIAKRLRLLEMEDTEGVFTQTPIAGGLFRWLCNRTKGPLRGAHEEALARVHQR